MTKNKYQRKQNSQSRVDFVHSLFGEASHASPKKIREKKKNDGLQAAWNSGRERTKSGCLLSSRVPRDALASYFFTGFFFFFSFNLPRQTSPKKRECSQIKSQLRKIQTASYEPVIKQILSAHVHILKYRQGKLTFRVSWSTRFSSFNTT